MKKCKCNCNCNIHVAVRTKYDTVKISEANKNRKSYCRIIIPTGLEEAIPGITKMLSVKPKDYLIVTVPSSAGQKSHDVIVPKVDIHSTAKQAKRVLKSKIP